MKKHIKPATLLLSLLLFLNLSACGGSRSNDNNNTTDTSLMAAEDLPGTWIDKNGNVLVLDVVENVYTYRTWYGRIGTGYLTGADNDDEKRRLEFCDFYYDFVKDDDGFTLKQNGSGDGESLDGFHFTTDSSDVPTIPLKTLDGMWQNALGETLVIDTGRMQYISCSSKQMANGALYNKDNGRGPYLFLNGYAYPRISADGNSFELFFAASDTESPDGTFSGVFYRDGKAAEYAKLDSTEFVERDGHLWYYDGVQFFAVPDGYTTGDDGLAYDKNGNVFGAGWEAPVYDPSVDWGDNWAESWEKDN